MPSAVYYIGGPADGRKEWRELIGQRYILVRHVGRIIPYHDKPDEKFAQYEDHRYVVRQVGREVFIALHDSLV